ncbi:MAG: hypothetical protein QOG50_3413, partial [Actinomycetota bacterium]|nr:hypothetical protein [Actinomycetota bacterium]
MLPSRRRKPEELGDAGDSRDRVPAMMVARVRIAEEVDYASWYTGLYITCADPSLVT